MRRISFPSSLVDVWPVALARAVMGTGSAPSGPPVPSGKEPLPVIAVIGASTASGYGLSDISTCWVNRYAAALALTHPDITVKNLSVAGYSSFEILPTG